MMNLDYEGNEELLIYDFHKVGVIGSRDVTSQELILALNKGRQVSHKFQTLVTGMANGVDTWAMVGALEQDELIHKNYKHIAVIPSIHCDGIPDNNSLLINEILQKDGLLIAPKDIEIDYKTMFLKRNDLLVEHIDELITVGKLGRGASYTERKARQKGIKVTNL